MIDEDGARLLFFLAFVASNWADSTKVSEFSAAEALLPRDGTHGDCQVYRTTVHLWFGTSDVMKPCLQIKGMRKSIQQQRAPTKY